MCDFNCVCTACAVADAYARDPALFARRYVALASEGVALDGDEYGRLYREGLDAHALQAAQRAAAVEVTRGAVEGDG